MNAVEAGVLLVNGKPTFIDFETCRDLVRVKTAAWCWADADRGDLRYHAEMHLAYLKKTFAGHA